MLPLAVRTYSTQPHTDRQISYSDNNDSNDARNGQIEQTSKITGSIYGGRESGRMAVLLFTSHIVPILC